MSGNIRFATLLIFERTKLLKQCHALEYVIIGKAKKFPAVKLIRNTIQPS
jgi:hypothetical protein